MPYLYGKTHAVGLLWNKWNISEERKATKGLYFRIFMELCAKDIKFDHVTQKFVGAREIPSHQEHAKNKKSGKPNASSATSSGTPQNSASASDNEPALLSVDLTQFGDARRQNPLFAGLVHDYPGWYPFEVEEGFEDSIPDEVDHNKLCEDFLIEENMAGLSLGDELNELEDSLTNLNV